MQSISLVVPCYNEAHRLDVDRFIAFARTHPGVHFIFVDDGSTDDTAHVLANLASECGGNAIVERMPRNRGKAEAVRAGMQRALTLDADLIGFWDADLATPLEELESLAANFSGNPALHMVMGSRVLLLGRRIDRRAARHYAGRVFATAVSLTLRLPVYDTQCGAKLLRRNEVTEGLFEAPFVSRWIFDVELIARLAKAVDARTAEAMARYLIEHPLMTWRDVPEGTLRLRDFVRSAVDLLRIRRHYRL